MHRVVFEHPLGTAFSIPENGGLTHLNASLLGVARSGGFGTLDAASHDPRAADLDDFMFTVGPAHRFAAHLLPGLFDLRTSLAGGISGDPSSSFQADQLRLWLVNDALQASLDPTVIVADGFESSDTTAWSSEAP